MPNLKTFQRLKHKLRIDNMTYSSRNGKKISKRVNTDDIVGTVLKYFEEHLTKIRKVFRSGHIKNML